MTPADLNALAVGDRCKYSTKFIRSIGNVGIWRAEVIGTVIERTILTSTILALVEWDGGNGYSEVNIQNLVSVKNVYREARDVEHRQAIPGIVMGSNAYAKS